MAVSFEEARERMVREQLSARGISDARVLTAMGAVPRHLFVELALHARAYEDGPLPIGAGQTISQPYIVALMTELLAVRGSDRVLEVGTGSGYQAAVLAEVAGAVFTIERLPQLADLARVRLARLGYGERVHIRVGNGTEGWPEEAPFEGIIITAAVQEVPRPLLEQLALDRYLVLPLGQADLQGLARIRRQAEGLRVDYFGECRFVKLIGQYGWEA